MARPADTRFRQSWYEEKLDAASTPQEKFNILRGKLAADIQRLPEELRDGTYMVAVDALQGVIEAVQDAMGDVETGTVHVSVIR